MYFFVIKIAHLTEPFLYYFDLLITIFAVINGFKIIKYWDKINAFPFDKLPIDPWPALLSAYLSVFWYNEQGQ